MCGDLGTKISGNGPYDKLFVDKANQDFPVDGDKRNS
jgi:hypothetical protein